MCRNDKQKAVQQYVTLFDSNYLTRGLVLYRSLVRYAQPFHLWILCFDELAYAILQQLDLQHATLVPLEAFEDADLLRVKPTRTWQEYCWTCTPSSVRYVFDTDPSVEAVTYLDADLMFFSSPQPLFDELGEASILLTEHRYVPGFEGALANGRFNVQFVTFRRDTAGLDAVNWWRDRCLEWCYARNEAGKYGDQKYLDDWPERFQNVHIAQHIGAGLAPWNAAQYRIARTDTGIMVDNIPLIFYHFHHLNIYGRHLAYLFDHFPIRRNVHVVYRAYLREIMTAYADVRRREPGFQRGLARFGALPTSPWRVATLCKSLVHAIVRGRYVWIA